MDRISCIAGMVLGLGFSGMVVAAESSGAPSSAPAQSQGLEMYSSELVKEIPPEDLDYNRTAGVAEAVSPYPNTTGSQRSFRIAGSIFKPRNNNVSYEPIPDGGCIKVTAGSAVFTAPVMLPDGAAVEYVRLYYNDTNASVNSIAWFTVYNLYGNIVEEYPITSQGSSGTGYTTTDKIDPVRYIDYNANSYVLNWRPNAADGSIALCGMRLYYYMPSRVR